MAGQENIHLGGDDGGFGDIDHLADGDARMDYYKFTFSEEFAQNPLAFADTCAFVKEHDNVFHRANATAYELVGSTSRMFLPGKNFVFRVEGDRFSVSVYTPKILAQNDVYEALVIEGGKVTINGE